MGRDGSGVDGTYVEKVKLIGGGSNAGCEEEDVTLQPGYFHGGTLVAGSWV